MSDFKLIIMRVVRLRLSKYTRTSRVSPHAGWRVVDVAWCFMGINLGMEIVIMGGGMGCVTSVEASTHIMKT